MLEFYLVGQRFPNAFFDATIARHGIESARPAGYIQAGTSRCEPSPSRLGHVFWFDVQVRMKDAPKTVRTVSGQRNLAFTAKDGVVTFRLDLAEADYVLLMR